MSTLVYKADANYAVMATMSQVFTRGFKVVSKTTSGIFEED